MELITSFASFKFDWKVLNPNLPLVRGFFRKCGTLYDGYQFPINKPNGTLAGYRLEGFTIPFMFGMNEYYELNETVQDAASEQSKTALLWCGELYSGISYALSQSGGQGVFRPMPSTVESAVLTMMSPYSIAPFAIIFAAIYESFPIVRRGAYILNVGMGNMVTRKIYMRREFAFLECFSTDTWLCLFGTLLILSNITTLIGRRSSGVDTLPAIWIHDAALRRRRRQRKPQTECWNLVSWWRVALDFFGAILGEEQPGLDHFYRGIVGVWLLASVVFNGCLSSSLRGLMSKAQVVYTPESYDDIFHGSLYADHVIALSNWLPSWEGIGPRFAEEIAERQVTGRLLLLDPFKMLMEMKGGLMGLVKRLIDIFLEIDRHVVILFKRIFFMAMWGSTVCRTALDRAYAIIVKYEATKGSDGDQAGGGLLGIDNMESITDDEVSQSHNRIEDMLREMREHVSISEGIGTFQWYFPFLNQCPPQVRIYLNGFFDYFRDSGFIQLLDEKAEDALQTKFVTSQQLDWGSSAAGWEVLQLKEFNGPLASYFCFILISTLALLLELVVGRKKKLNGKPSKVHPKNEGQVVGAQKEIRNKPPPQTSEVKKSSIRQDRGEVSDQRDKLAKHQEEGQTHTMQSAAAESPLALQHRPSRRRTHRERFSYVKWPTTQSSS